MHTTKKALSLIALIAAAVTTPVFGAHVYSDSSVGYLIDSKDAMGSTRLGVSLLESAGQSHNLEFEVAYTSSSEFGTNLKLIPLMVNYRLIAPVSGKFDVFVGGGIGSTNVRVTASFLKQTDMVFTYQAFAGFGYRVSDKLSLTLGARFIDIGKMDFFSTKVDVGDDTELAAGLRLKF